MRTDRDSSSSHSIYFVGQVQRIRSSAKPASTNPSRYAGQKGRHGASGFQAAPIDRRQRPGTILDTGSAPLPEPSLCSHAPESPATTSCTPEFVNANSPSGRDRLRNVVTKSWLARPSFLSAQMPFVRRLTRNRITAVGSTPLCGPRRPRAGAAAPLKRVARLIFVEFNRLHGGVSLGNVHR